MSASNAFDEAIDEALRLSTQYDCALQLIEELTEELNRSVSARTGGTVSVELMTERKVSGLDLGRALGLTPPRMGRDQEDKQTRLFVIASNRSDTKRALWEVELADGGYPVVIHGPAADSSVTYIHEDDVRLGFIEAARHGRVGHKLAALATPSSAQRPANDDPA